MSISKYLAAAVLIVQLSSSSGFAAELPLASSESVLVLRNDFVLQGWVTPLGDQFLVTQANSDRIHILATKVEMVCASLEDAYLRKRDSVSASDVRAHLALASWCLRHRLQARAADQLLAAIALDPGHPQIPSLKNRLRLTNQPAPPDSEPSSVALAATEAESSIAPVALSTAAIQEFTTQVQPLLINRCAAGACHGPDSESDLQLTRPPVGHLISSRLTQRNLRAVLPFVESSAPLSSPLLTVPQQPHGGSGEAILGNADSSQADTLRRWLARLKKASSKSRLVDNSVFLEKLQKAEYAVEYSSDATREPVVPTAAQTDAEAEEAGDPFDPERFNRSRGSD